MVIGVTGGVGTGKSSILQILKEDYTAAIIICDDVARELMMPGGASYAAVAGYFGEGILTDGRGSEIDRAALAEIVFNDPEKLKILNSMTHPIVKDEVARLIGMYKSAGYKYIVIEAALLIQAGYLDILDELWLVHTDYEVRLKRLMESRGYSKEKTDSIIGSQMSDEEMSEYADFIIDNSGDPETTRKQIHGRINAGDIGN